MAVTTVIKTKSLKYTIKVSGVVIQKALKYVVGVTSNGQVFKDVYSPVNTSFTNKLQAQNTTYTDQYNS